MCRFALLTALLSVCQSPHAAGAAEPNSGASEKLKKRLIELIRKSKEYPEKLKEKGRKIITSRVKTYSTRDKGEQPDGPDFAEVLEYDYPTGETLRSTVNLRTERLVKFRRLPAYPTPLTKEEAAQAREVATSGDEKLKKLTQKYPPAELKYQELVIVISDKKAKLFGNRIVIVYVTPAGKASESVSVGVNLTSGAVLTPQSFR